MVKLGLFHLTVLCELSMALARGGFAGIPQRLTEVLKADIIWASVPGQRNFLTAVDGSNTVL